jgi:hypothetical protein
MARITKKFNSATVSKLFDDVVDNIESFIVQSASFSIKIYSKKGIIDRTVQIIASFEKINFGREVTKNPIGLNNKLANDRVINLRRFQYDPRTEKLKIKLFYFILSVAKFFLKWLQIFFVSLVKRDKFLSGKESPLTLLYGMHSFNLSEIPYRNGFIDFCKKGPIVPLSSANFLIIEGRNSDNTLFKNEYFLYNKDPILALFKAQKLSITDFFKFSILHLNVFLQYFKLIISFPIFAILYDDFAYYSVVNTLNSKRAIKDVILTVGSSSFQPLWMSSIKDKSFRTHMIWYAKSTIWEYVYKFDKSVYTTRAEFRHIRVDETWSWTQGFSNYLKSIGVTGEFHNVGPILFYMPTVEKTPVSNVINIVIFDAIPRKKTVSDSILGEKNIYTYGSLQNLTDFLKDIISVSELYGKSVNRTVKLSLKHKRKLHPWMSREYFDLVNSLLNEHESLEIVPIKVNLYSLIKGADLVLSVPYSSSLYLSNYLNTLSIFYDPTTTLVPLYEKGDNISFASGKGELLARLEELI